MLSSAINILGVRVDNYSLREVLQILSGWIGERRRAHAVTVNPEFVVRAQKDSEFKEALNRSDLAICDGVGVYWASRLLNSGVKERIAGVDLMEELCRLASKRDWKVFLLGARAGVAKKAARELKRQFAKLNILGTYEGNSHPTDDKLVINQIKKLSGGSHIDLLFVAYGHPNQEKWISRNLRYLDVGVAMGVGGALDYLSGTVPRAPLFLRKLGFEWLYRLLRQPSRWRRQLALPKFAYLVLKQRLLANKKPRRIG